MSGLGGEVDDPCIPEVRVLCQFVDCLRGETPPADIVDFFAGTGADIREIAGPIRDISTSSMHRLEQRIHAAAQLGAVAYIPSGRGGDVEMEPADAELQLELFGD